MKKFTFLILVIFLSATGLFAQMSLKDFLAGEEQAPVVTLKSISTQLFDEPEGSVFFYPAVSSATAYTSDENEGYKCYQSFSGVTGSFDVVKIWAVHVTPPSGSRQIEVELYEAGATPGVVVNTVTVNAEPAITGQYILGFPIYEYTLSIPTTNLTEGWISIQAVSGGTPTFYWLNTNATPSYPALQNSTVLSGLSISFISSTPVPLAGWGIILLFVLIALPFVIKYVRIGMRKEAV